MANITVSYQEIRDAAGRLVTGQQDITAKLTELKGFIANLISSGFVTDQASVAFGESYDKYTAATTQVISSLTDLSNYLQRAATTLENTDAQLASGLR